MLALSVVSCKPLLFPDYSGTYYFWKKKFLVYGEEGLNHQKLKDSRNLVSKLEKEVQTLKILLGEKELENKLKDDLLKKKYPELRRKR